MGPSYVPWLVFEIKRKQANATTAVADEIVVREMKVNETIQIDDRQTSSCWPFEASFPSSPSFRNQLTS
jgi:hypothetical protein